ncbi:hypothetical protein GH865_12090 [Rhodocyclus tenuis]|uniref:helix-turn-helix domain-containing protein n=1 Tax=Rhodocyclus gracilis TaxID=2929842 RepID=UPI001298D570|nr:helix-turn-helix domain-containing protein [Rhodocyclus gracilis]MRD73981.1 hypothetical protein [Rhodocyclus gracilis]
MSAAATKWAWEQIATERAHGLAALVLLKLADRVDDSGVCWPGHERTAKDCNASPKGTRLALAELEKCGLITVERRMDSAGRSLSHRYRLKVCAREEVGSEVVSTTPPEKQGEFGAEIASTPPEKQGCSGVVTNASESKNRIIKKRETSETDASRLSAPSFARELTRIASAGARIAGTDRHRDNAALAEARVTCLTSSDHLFLENGLRLGG